MLGLILALGLAKVCLGCNFTGAQLAGSDFSGVVYVGSNFASAQLSKASFRGARLVAANFENADLRGAVFDGSQCTACNFDGAKFDGATFAGSWMVAANFAGFNSAVAGDQLRDLLGSCISCNFRGSTLAGRDFSDLALISEDFSSADLRGTNFIGSTFCWYVVVGARRTVKCDALQNAQVDGANFAGVRACMDPADASTCSPVDGASLRRYTGSNLSGATLP